MFRNPAYFLYLVLEIVAFIVVGQWGEQVGRASGSAVLHYAGLIVPPLILAGLLILFTAQNDPWHTSRMFIPVTGQVRLFIELMVFAFAVWTLLATGRMVLGLSIALAVLLQYFLSLDRVGVLLQKQ